MDQLDVTAAAWAEQAATCLSAVRHAAPHVHVLTSTVAQPLTANLLLAAGAQPSMSGAPGEIEAFVARTGSLVVNLGMLDAARRDAIERALPVLAERRTPWVLDPVKVERSPQRLLLARELVARAPTVVRANGVEMARLELPATIVGAVTGAVDEVRCRGHAVRFGNGHGWMDRVTAMGCAGTALVATFLTVEPDAFKATGAALLALGVVGEIAAEQARGPGTFAAAFLDALFHLEATQLAARARLA